MFPFPIGFHELVDFLLHFLVADIRALHFDDDWNVIDTGINIWDVPFIDLRLNSIDLRIP